MCSGVLRPCPRELFRGSCLRAGLLAACTLTTLAGPRRARAEAPVLRTSGAARGGGAVSGDGDVHFVDVAAERGLKFVHQNGGLPLADLVQTTGSGVCVLDYDGDGDDDVLLVNGGVRPGSRSGEKRQPSRLFRNDAGHFTDVTDEAGLANSGDALAGMGCAVGDVDGDGHDDILITGWGPDELFLSDGHGHFRDVAPQAGLADGRWNTAAAFADYDGDGDLDLYVGAYVDLPPGPSLCPGPRGESILCRPFDYRGQPGRLYRNDGLGPDGVPRFTDVTAASRAIEPVGKTLGVLFEDLDGDERPDLYIANDTVRNTLLVNLGDGTFADRTLRAGVGYSDRGVPEAGMGVECGDLDGDGIADLLVTNFMGEPDRLYRGVGSGRFEDRTESSGLAAPTLPTLGWGLALADVDLDGDLDVLVVNGHVDDRVKDSDPSASYAERDQLFLNASTPGVLRLTEVPRALPEHPHVGRGCALLDYDGDGDLDVVVNVNGGPAELLENRTPRRDRHWIGVRLADAGGRTVIGAVVTVTTGEHVQRRQVQAGSSYASCSTRNAYFGLGSATKPLVQVRWPGGDVTPAVPLAADSVHVVAMSCGPALHGLTASPPGVAARPPARPSAPATGEAAADRGPWRLRSGKKP